MLFNIMYTYYIVTGGKSGPRSAPSSSPSPSPLSSRSPSPSSSSSPSSSVVAVSCRPCPRCRRRRRRPQCLYRELTECNRRTKNRVTCIQLHNTTIKYSCTDAPWSNSLHYYLFIIKSNTENHAPKSAVMLTAPASLSCTCGISILNNWLSW